MNQALEQALAKVLQLPNEKQALAAELLEQVASGAETYNLSRDERSAIREAMERARRSEFALEDEVDAALRQPWA